MSEIGWHQCALDPAPGLDPGRLVARSRIRRLAFRAEYRSFRRDSLIDGHAGKRLWPWFEVPPHDNLLQHGESVAMYPGRFVLQRRKDEDPWRR